MRDVLSSNDDKECVHCHNDTYDPSCIPLIIIWDLGPIIPALIVMFMEFPPYFLI